MNRTKFLLSAAIGLWLAGLLIATAPALAAEDGIEAQVFFGLSIPVGRQPCNGLYSVTDEAWGFFVAQHIGNQFPDAFTVVNAAGHWRGGHEPSRVLIVVVKATERAMLNEKLNALTFYYLGQFCQEEVFIITDDVSFTRVRSE